jgi:hypothetical protein
MVGIPWSSRRHADLRHLVSHWAGGQLGEPQGEVAVGAAGLGMMKFLSRSSAMADC